MSRRLYRPLLIVVTFSFCAIVVLTSGCVHRRLTVRSNPPGAAVYVDNQEIGTTPVTANYTYYGTREIRLEKAGFETLTVKQNLRPPWYQFPVLDFISENMLPHDIRDERELDFAMVPQIVVPREQILHRARQLRQNVKQGIVAPLPTVVPPAVSAPAPSKVPRQASTQQVLPQPVRPQTTLPAARPLQRLQPTGQHRLPAPMVIEP